MSLKLVTSQYQIRSKTMNGRTVICQLTLCYSLQVQQGFFFFLSAHLEQCVVAEDLVHNCYAYCEPLDRKSAQPHPHCYTKTLITSTKHIKMYIRRLVNLWKQNRVQLKQKDIETLGRSGIVLSWSTRYCYKYHATSINELLCTTLIMLNIRWRGQRTSKCQSVE